MRLLELRLFALALGASPLWAQLYPPVTDLSQTADLVTFATVRNVQRDTLTLTVELLLARPLKGQPQSPTIFAHALATTPGAIGPLTGLEDLKGKSGIWFLKLATNGYEILLRNKRGYKAADMFLPAKDTGTNDMLGYQVAWYQSLTQPTATDDNMLLSSFEQWHAQSPSPELVAKAVAPLLQSNRDRVIGLTAEIRAGLATSGDQIVNQLPTLTIDPKFQFLLTSLDRYPKDKTWIAPLTALALQGESIPGMQGAVAAALRRIGTKDALPTMVFLLDSKDPEAQLEAASFFATYARLADQHGNMAESGGNGPFATSDTKAFTPQLDSQIPPSQYAAFWKNWWNQNRTKIGF